MESGVIIVSILVFIFIVVLVIAVVLHAQSISNKLRIVTTDVVQGLNTFGSQFATFGAVALRGIVVFGTTMVQTFVGILQRTVNAFDMVSTQASGTFARAVAQANRILTGALQQLGNIFVTSMDFIGSFAASVERASVNLAGESFIQIVTSFTNLVNGLVHFLENQANIAFATVETALSGAAATVVQFFQNITDQVQALIQTMQGQWPAILSFFTDTFDPAINAIQSAANAIFSGLVEVLCAFCYVCHVIPFCSRPDVCFQYC